jgi:hypothetical protein
MRSPRQPCPASASHELVLADRLAGALNERDQNVQGSAAEAQRYSVLKQHPLSRNQAERSEGESFFIHRGIVSRTSGFIQTKETLRNVTAGHPRLLPQIRCPQIIAKAALAHLHNH